VQTKTAGCVAHGGLPDSACTPGAIFANVTKTQVCTPGYASSVRDVPQSVKTKVYAEYGLPSTCQVSMRLIISSVCNWAAPTI
jgi:hypothetical protein